MGYPPPPQGGEGGEAAQHDVCQPAHRPSVYVFNVLVSVVCDIVVDRLCDIVTGGTVVLGAVVLGAVVRTVELLGRNGGETGDFVLRINH